MLHPSFGTNITPKLAPTPRAFGKIARTTSGVAAVAMSMSVGVKPNSRSRTHPPAK